MQKIVPHLWFDKEAKEAAEFYVAAFGGNSRVTALQTLHDTPSGDAHIVGFTLLGHEFMSISAGPLFKFNPSVSFSVVYQTKEEVDTLWNKLVQGGKVLMELDAYPYSERYGWLEDKYGLSWQIISTGDTPVTQTIIPGLLFTGDVCGKAEEAMNYYATVFKDAKVGDLYRYPAGQEPDKEGTIAHGVVTLEGQQFFAMDSARMHNFGFNEAISLMVSCKDQAEVDYYWDTLTKNGGQESQCGWLKDKYGFSWQITPIEMNEMMAKGTPEQINRVTQAFLKMKKFDIATLKKAYEG